MALIEGVSDGSPPEIVGTEEIVGWAEMEGPAEVVG